MAYAVAILSFHNVFEPENGLKEEQSMSVAIDEHILDFTLVHTCINTIVEIEYLGETIGSYPVPTVRDALGRFLVHLYEGKIDWDWASMRVRQAIDFRNSPVSKWKLEC